MSSDEDYSNDGRIRGSATDFIDALQGINIFDKPKLAIEHALDFHRCGIPVIAVDRLTSKPLMNISKGSQTLLDLEKTFDIEKVPRQYNIEILCGVISGIIVLNINNRGDFVPKLNSGNYGIRHTTIGNLLCQTKRIITGAGNTNVILGIYQDEWPDGLPSCQLVQPGLDRHGSIDLLSDGCYALVEPSIHPAAGKPYRFYTPLHCELDAESKSKKISCVSSLHDLGIMTLHRHLLTELLQGFNPTWNSGRAYATNNPYVWPQSKLSDAGDSGKFCG